MKRFISIISLVLLGLNALMAADSPTGLMIVFNDESREATTELFANNPVLTHSADGRTITITAGERNVLTVAASEVKEMTFCEIKDTPTGVSQIVTPKGESHDIYDLNGCKVNIRSAKGIVIINGRKTIVR